MRRWLELTGRPPDDGTNAVILSKSWGKDARWVGARVKGAMSVGKACISEPPAFFESTGLENLDFEKYPFKTSGLFGNLPFGGRFTVVVDLPHQQFELFQGSLAGMPPKSQRTCRRSSE